MFRTLLTLFALFVVSLCSKSAAADAVTSDGYRAQLKWIQEYNVSQEVADRILRATYKEAAAYNLDPKLLLAIAQTESAFHPKVASRFGALGVWQVVPRFHKGRMKKLGATNLLNIEDCARVSADLMRELLNSSKGSLQKALYAYSGGSKTYAKIILRRMRSVPGDVITRGDILLTSDLHRSSEYVPTA